uniref:RBR-type E3 ubiquitin transferase n=1 Tax=Arcella intermedia TaxID=1963864 RepID=A0A6B2L1I9_9EUKA
MEDYALENYEDYTADSTALEDEKGPKIDYKVHSREDINHQIEKNVEMLMSMFCLDKSDAIYLLRKNGWDYTRLVDELGDEDYIKKNGLKYDTTITPKEPFECPICMEGCKLADTYSLCCGHTYCKNCWRSFAQEQMASNSVLEAFCPYPKCKTPLTETTFQLFLSPEKFEQYKRLVLDSYVTTSNLRKWCPSPGCANYIQLRISSNEPIPVECTCSFRFCFQCNDYEIGDHAPADCEMVSNWIKKAADESENVQWITANTKKCTRCQSHIEKNGGCMHMTCRKCGHEFCWLCRKDWKGHSACNKSENIKQEEENAKNAANQLENYMFHWHRYNAHRNAMKIASQQILDSSNKGQILVDNLKLRIQDIQFIKEASLQLKRNRNMLQNSYIYAFYQTFRRITTSEKELFLYLQTELEHHTDKLSEMYEKEVDTLKSLDYSSFVQWKTNVSNYTRICQKFLQNFIEGVIFKTLTHPEGYGMSDDERFYLVQLETLEGMGLSRELTLPLLIKYNGNVERVVNAIYS